VWSPSIGGMETIGSLLAEQIAEQGHDLVVVTPTQSDRPDVGLKYAVIRGPSAGQLLRLTRWADVVLQHGPSLRLGWPLLVMRKRVAISLHMLFDASDWVARVKVALKRLWLRRAAAIVVPSDYMRSVVGLRAHVIPNCYDPRLFGGPVGAYLALEAPRDESLIACVARLIPAKGVGLLLHAVAQRRQQFRSVEAKFRIIGEGPQRRELEDLASALGVGDIVRFEGGQSSEGVASLLRQAHVLAVPSIYPEAFGIIALEGVASGCVVVAADSGALPEAAGPEAIVYNSVSTDALGAALIQALSRRRPTAMEVAEHCRSFQPAQVADRYLNVLGRIRPVEV